MTRIVDHNREETDPCTHNTPGCCIDHEAESKANHQGDESCETW